MSPEKARDQSPESQVTGMTFKDTELTLAPPGAKRGLVDAVDLQSVDGAAKSPPPKAQVVGWPPVRATRKKATELERCKYVKVGVDGAPYLRKIDLQTCESYFELMKVLEDLFICFNIRRDGLQERKLVDLVKGVEYLPTYQDKDGDWMLVGDVPWQMFIETCKRIWLLKSSEAVGLGTTLLSEI